MIEPETVKIDDAYIEKYCLNKHTDKRDCIIIGSNPSILKHHMKDFIDSETKTVIRINRTQDVRFSNNYGTKCDLYFGCEYLQEQLSNQKNKMIISHQDIIDISSPYFITSDKWFTTGFICILLALNQFDHVYLFGFGENNDINNTEKFVTITETLEKTHHDLNLEHSFIDDMEK